MEAGYLSIGLNKQKMGVHGLLYVILIVLSGACSLQLTGDPKLIPIGPLPKELDESSGMYEYSPDTYVGHNDSGHGPYLYVFSIDRKSGTRTVKVTNAKNVDWEEITGDDTYLYISDAGNNMGDRKDLTIYRIKTDDIKKHSEVEADKITFSYPEQTSYKPGKNHNFDCEALICMGDSLYLFTKNRKNLMTDIYRLPKQPGNYAAIHHGGFDSDGLVTGSAYRNVGGKQELVLVGYNNRKLIFTPFLIHVTGFEGSSFFSGQVRRINFQSSSQIETVVFGPENTAMVTNEEEHGDQGLIYKVSLK
jgi:hypothetical protein